MKIKFRDILQCANGPLMGLLAQVTSATDSEVELLSRDMDGESHVLRVTASEIASWRHTCGVAINGPKQQQSQPISEPGAATDGGVPSGQDVAPDATGSSDVAPVRDPLSDPLDVASLMEPLPPGTKIVPMVHEEPAPAAPPAPVWDMDDPPPTPEEKLASRRAVNSQRSASNPLPKIKYSATVSNGGGEVTRVEYSLRKGVAPEKFACIPIKMAKKFIEDVAPLTVLSYTPLP